MLEINSNATVARGLVPRRLIYPHLILIPPHLNPSPPGRGNRWGYVSHASRGEENGKDWLASRLPMTKRSKIFLTLLDNT